MKPPGPQYAWNGSTALAYQIVGSTGPDLLFVPGSVTHLEMLWRHPPVVRFLERVAGFSRLIVMDPRGLGLSDRLTEIPTLDERVSDLVAVLDAAGSDRATLFGNADSGPAAIAAAALNPSRVAGLILCGTYARATRADDYQFGATDEDWQDFADYVRHSWGNPERERLDARDPAFGEWWTAMMRTGASPRAVLLLGEMTRTVDVRPLLSRVVVPTLVMHRIGDRVNSVEHGRYLARNIPNSRWVELGGDEFELWAGDIGSIADEIEEFLTGRRDRTRATREVATLMFTDFVESTERITQVGDGAWADLLETHHARVRAELARFGGREIDTAGDGFFATFESPSAAISCATAIVRSLREIGIDIRAGIHTGECEVVGDNLRGLAVVIGARVAHNATAGQILVSQTVKDLLAGSSIAFQEQGIVTLKGVPGEWRLYSVSPLVESGHG